MAVVLTAQKKIKRHIRQDMALEYVG